MDDVIFCNNFPHRRLAVQNFCDFGLKNRIAPKMKTTNAKLPEARTAI